MADQSPEKGFTLLNWITCAAALLCLGLLAWFIPYDRETLKYVFVSFHSTLPAITIFVLEIPTWLFPLTALLAGIGVMLVQIRTRSKALAALIHLAAIVMCLVVFTAYREVMAQPMMSLIRAISGTE